ncbi:kinase-like protein [Verticillium dahliae]
MADASPTQHPGLIAVPWLSIDRKDARQIIFVAQGAFNKLYLVQAAGQDDLILRVSLPVDPRFKTPSEVATLEWMSRNTELPVPKVMLHDASRHSRISFEWILMSKLPGEVWATGWEDVPRGPFKTTRDWTQVRLMLSSRESHGKIAKYSAQSEMGSDDEDDLHDAQQTLDIIKKLQPLVDVVFPPAQDPEPEATMLFHDDLSLHNILVDRDGNLTGVVDWECVSALPLWASCYFPTFLNDQPRNSMPDRANYDVEPNGEIDGLYWDHVKEYELTRLRKTFLEEMASLEPGWMEVFESSAQKRDPDMAVRKCDNDFLAKRIQGWVDDVTKGRVDGPGLLERIYDD